MPHWEVEINELQPSSSRTMSNRANFHSPRTSSYPPHPFHSTQWFWRFWGSKKAPHLVGKYIIPGDPFIAPPISHGTVDGRNHAPVEVGSLSHYLQGFLHPKWCRISSINSSNPPLIACLFVCFVKWRTAWWFHPRWRNCPLISTSFPWQKKRRDGNERNAQKMRVFLKRPWVVRLRG